MAFIARAGYVSSWAESIRKRRFKYYVGQFEKLYFQTRLFGYEYEDAFVKLDAGGGLWIKPGAPSDGCSPGWLVLDWFYITIPDGPVDGRTGKPVTYRAFYVHDYILYICWKLGLPVQCFKIAHLEFCSELQPVPWKRWLKHFYCGVVKWLGPRGKLYSLYLYFKNLLPGV